MALITRAASNVCMNSSVSARCGVAPVLSRRAAESSRARGASVISNAWATRGGGPDGPGRTSLITSISAVVENQAAVQKFETLAGRTAMISFIPAFLVEVIGGMPVVGMSSEQTQVFAAALLLAVAASVAGATMRKRAIGGLLLEGVVASLTSVQGSASSMTSTNPSGLDATVDLIMEREFDQNLTSFLESSVAPDTADE